MFFYKERIKIAVFIFIGALGLATGINYGISVSQNAFSTIKGCFEFGIYPLLDGGNNTEIIIDTIACSIKHYLLFLSGAFFWVLFPLTVINLFCLCFKIGVCIEYVFSTVGLEGFLSCVLMLILCLLIILTAIVFSYFVLNKRISNKYQNRLNLQDFQFIKRSILGLVIFIIALILFLFAFKFTGSTLYGLLNTFL